MSKKTIEVTTVRDANVVSAEHLSPITGASHANAGVTADAAHYLFSFETERSVNAAELAVLAQKEANRGTVTEAELAIGALKGVILDLCNEYGAITISTSFGTFETRCAGSVDNAFSLPEEGSVYLDFTFSDAQRREFARIEARVPVAGETACIKRVTTHNPHGRGEREKVLLVGQMFHLEGVNITYGGTGESLSLWDLALTAKVCDVTVNTHSSKNLWYCTMPDTAITPGRYKLVLNSFAGGDSLVQLTHEVDVEGEPTPPPEPTPIWESSDGLVKVLSVADGETGDTLTWGNAWSVLGEGFTGTEPGWFVEIAQLRPAPGADPVMLDIEVRSATEVVLTPGTGAELEAGDYPNAELTFGIAHESGEGLVNETAEIPVHIVVGA